MARNTKSEVTKHIYRGKAAVAAVILSLHLTHVTFDCGMKSSFAPAPIWSFTKEDTTMKRGYNFLSWKNASTTILNSTYLLILLLSTRRQKSLQNSIFIFIYRIRCFNIDFFIQQDFSLYDRSNSFWKNYPICQKRFVNKLPRNSFIIVK